VNFVKKKEKGMKFGSKEELSSTAIASPSEHTTSPKTQK